MAQVEDWTQDISERLIDIQIITERMIDADGERTPAEAELIAHIHETQGAIQAVEDEITEAVFLGSAVLQTIRTGKMPRRMVRALAQNETPDAA